MRTTKGMTMKGRRGIAALLTVALMVAASMAAGGGSFAYGADGSGDMTYVSVGLVYGTSAVERCEIKSDDGFQIVNISDGMEETLPLLGYDHLIVEVTNGIITVSDSDGVTLITDLGDDNVIMNGDYLGDGTLTVSVNNREYRGGIKFFVRDNGLMNVINYLSLDRYLYGVLQGEMGHQNPEEALKAQAVAARSYAMTNISSHKSEGFSLCTNTHCQMYYGVSYEHPETVAAVDETSELVIWYNGRIVPAYYHKNSGGYTQNSEDVWNSKEGYLRAVKDEYCPEYNWTASFTWDQLAEKVTNIGRIKDAYISGWADNGSVSELTLEGTGGTKTLSKENIRMVLGSSKVKSLRFTLAGGSGGDTSETVAASAVVLNGDGKTEHREDVAILSAAGSRRASSLDGLTVLGSSGPRLLQDTVKQSSAAATGDGITLTGLGYGHSVGMCQDSAILMAQDGWDFEEILHYFYTDIDVDYVSR